MNLAPKSFAALALILALTACGGGGEEDTDIAATEAPAATDAAPAPTDTATPTETPGATPTETAGPTPTPTPTATASAAPTTAAVAEPASFAQCKACHSMEPGQHGLGPSLAGVFGDRAGTVAGFDFSDAMKESGLVWNQANLDRFLADPRGVVPGTKMAFGGVKDAAKRQEIINYMRAN